MFFYKESVSYDTLRLLENYFEVYSITVYIVQVHILHDKCIMNNGVIIKHKTVLMHITSCFLRLFWLMFALRTDMYNF